MISAACLAAGCATTGATADTPEARNARESYDQCLAYYVARADDSDIDLESAGENLADYCLREFTVYSGFTGLQQHDNIRIATQVVMSHRQH